MLKAPRMGETPLDHAFDVVDVHVGHMDRQWVAMRVLSLVGSFRWAEPQPPEVSGAVS